jgi:hypothetical protein
MLQYVLSFIELEVMSPINERHISNNNKTLKLTIVTCITF